MNVFSSLGSTVNKNGYGNLVLKPEQKECRPDYFWPTSTSGNILSSLVCQTCVNAEIVLKCSNQKSHWLKTNCNN